MRIRLMACLVLLAAPLAALAQQRTHDITPDDYFTLAAISEVAVSPDGRYVAYCEARWDKSDDGRKTDLWVVSTDGKSKPKRLTFDRANDRKPKWSADSRTIHVLGNRKREAEKKPPFDGTTQVWKVTVDSADVRPITKTEGGVTGYDYASKVNVLFTSRDKKATDTDDFSKLRAEFDKIEYGHGTRQVSEINKLDLRMARRSP
jgi:dipeptidyl aminopeptidase/acylaminoacyl peptidase